MLGAIPWSGAWGGKKGGEDGEGRDGGQLAKDEPVRRENWMGRHALVAFSLSPSPA